ncbi:MAG: MBL fold metallo-hydrolase [Bowdeniella nasicola]|nr:MBL fold metallo-hydrolase [Bowdeniella nasicola]
MSGPKSPSSCYLVQAEDDTGRIWSLALDLGSGALGAMWRVCSPAYLDGIVLSHMHADHVVDMIGLHVFRRWHPDGPFAPIPVIAPDDALERVRGIGGDGPEEKYLQEFDFLPHDPNTVRTIGPFTIESFPVLHPVPAYAVRITGPSEFGRESVVLTYSGDSDMCEGLIAAAKNATLFLCEAAFTEGLDTVRGVHLTGRRAGKVAAAAKPQTMVLTHIQPWTNPHTILQEALEVWQGAIAVASAEAVWQI